MEDGRIQRDFFIANKLGEEFNLYTSHRQSSDWSSLDSLLILGAGAVHVLSLVILLCSLTSVLEGCTGCMCTQPNHFTMGKNQNVRMSDIT